MYSILIYKDNIWLKKIEKGGQGILFWHDKWMSLVPLKEMFQGCLVYISVCPDGKVN
jgi:hypothetical protein